MVEVGRPDRAIAAVARKTQLRPVLVDVDRRERHRHPEVRRRQGIQTQAAEVGYEVVRSDSLAARSRVTSLEQVVREEPGMAVQGEGVDRRDGESGSLSDGRRDGGSQSQRGGQDDHAELASRHLHPPHVLEG
jgi:hypothetical protein